MGISPALGFDIVYDSPWTADQTADLANIVGFGIHGSGSGTSYPEVKDASMM